MKTLEKRYNGWKNYETWNVALWLGNDEPLYRSMRSQKPFRTNADMESFVLDVMPNGTPDFEGKVSRYSKVDWSEIKRFANED